MPKTLEWKLPDIPRLTGEIAHKEWKTQVEFHLDWFKIAEYATQGVPSQSALLGRPRDACGKIPWVGPKRLALARQCRAGHGHGHEGRAICVAWNRPGPPEVQRSAAQ